METIVNQPPSKARERQDRPDVDAQRYYLANKDGIDSWNAYVAEHGLPLAEYSDF